MIDPKEKDSMPIKPMDDSSRAQWVMAIGVFVCGVVLAVIEFARLDMSNGSFSQCLFFTALFVGPYVLLSACIPLAWNSKVGRALVGLATVLVLYLGVSLVLIGKPPSGPGAMSGLVVLLLPAYQYVIGAVALVASIIIWSIDAWRHRHDRRHVSPSSSFDHKLVVEMERAMESKETADLKTILAQAENSPGQYANELVEAVRTLLVQRGETPSP
jgi:hypothetical protein